MNSLNFCLYWLNKIDKIRVVANVVDAFLPSYYNFTSKVVPRYIMFAKLAALFEKL